MDVRVRLIGEGLSLVLSSDVVEVLMYTKSGFYLLRSLLDRGEGNVSERPGRKVLEGRACLWRKILRLEEVMRMD